MPRPAAPSLRAAAARSQPLSLPVLSAEGMPGGDPPSAPGSHRARLTPPGSRQTGAAPCSKMFRSSAGYQPGQLGEQTLLSKLQAWFFSRSLSQPCTTFSFPLAPSAAERFLRTRPQHRGMRALPAHWRLFITIKRPSQVAEPRQHTSVLPAEGSSGQR